MASPQQRRAARYATSEEPPAPRKAPITADRITDAALEIVAADGFDAMTMRSVAARLDTGPASLYAHVVNKADLDELLIGRLCSRIVLPQPSATQWREQLAGVCTQLRDQYLTYPGISRAALAIDVTNLDVLRVNEGMLAILITAGIDPQVAAWTIDALFLYVGAYAMDIAVADSGSNTDEHRFSTHHRKDLIARFEALPEDGFPHIRAHATELTSGTAHERFDFTLGLMLRDLDRSAVSIKVTCQQSRD
ncbi:TetR/AcrR family transcriptional regulator [Arthrobacter sp. zg-Y750]|uniref:TetR/AcrR family transcriptional regulator n=1 Tax=Arthrobacter sp. zg-Y750 TaxID=2894189 RepID=UPI001E28B69A|nr:TetR/AcrR family transcriptional regulator [Arthrobacter sp. zg-Y750]MCC9177461.1 TetR/AcrR family transcriptional regulator [Arthrobacter sp. zg-Y750]